MQSQKQTQDKRMWNKINCLLATLMCFLCVAPMFEYIGQYFRSPTSCSSMEMKQYNFVKIVLNNKNLKLTAVVANE